MYIEVNNTAGITRTLAEMRNMYMERFRDWSKQGDLSMAAVALSDLADSMSVIDYLNRGCAEHAEQRLWKMDTSPREYLYEALERNGVIQD
jgi:nitrogen regulatory protein PII-like uncharacterized protein